MNQLEVGRKRQQIKRQYRYVFKITDWVCLQNTSDYSPFGVTLDGRTIERDFYRRGFNGMEKDDEVKGEGNSYDFGARIYDSRVGRWWSVDILSNKYPYLSPYLAFENNPICLIDPDGKDAIITVEGNTITVSAKIYIMNNGKVQISVADVQKAANEYFNNQDFEFKEKNKTYTVKFDIQVMEQTGNEDPNDASKNWVRPKAEGSRSEIVNYRYGYWAKGDRTLQIAHEIGHFLGLGDQYFDLIFDAGNLNYNTIKTGDIKAENYPNVAINELMGKDASNKKAKLNLTKRDINAISKYALNTLKSKRKTDGKVVVDIGKLTRYGAINGLAGPTEQQVTDEKFKERERGWEFSESHSQN